MHQLAEGGTIVLEGIEDLPAKGQLALLQVLQEIEAERTGVDYPIWTNVRLIAIARRDLRAVVAVGAFRSDLFDLLNVLPIRVLPLRQRKEEIPLMARYFLSRYSGRTGRALPSLTPTDIELLKSYPWPSNVQELQCVMERWVDLCDAELFSTDARSIPGEFSTQPEPSGLIPNQQTLLEIALIEVELEAQRKIDAIGV
jgi:DNA-binding NtrC family response regulator